MFPNTAFSCPKCASPTIRPIGIICILFVCLTTRMNLSTQSAQPWTSLYFVQITTRYSWAWGHYTHGGSCLRFLDVVDIAFPAGKCSSKWRIWISGVQLKYDTGKGAICPRRVLSRSFSSLCIYWTPMLWASDMIPWLTLVYSTLQSTSRCSTEVGLWNGWPQYSSPFLS